MSEKVHCFVAYPGEPRRAPEIILAALKMVNTPELEFLPWEELRISGRDLRYLILEEKIRNSDLFMCDLSGLNQNVLFELGFAIAIGKRIWTICSEDDVSALEKFPLMRPIGHRPYRNSGQIQTHFYTDMPHTHLGETLRRDILPSEDLEPDESILYVKSAKDTEESLRLSRALEVLPLFTDDSQESPNRSLDWYAEKAFRASGVVLHLLRNDDARNLQHNAKCALVAGMARGFGKDLLMLAHDPFRTPIDYENLLKVHSTPSACAEFARPWIEAHRIRLASSQASIAGSAERARRTNLLHSISVGDYVAENEAHDLQTYFVPTEHHESIKRSGNSLVVGRKGSGKTASLLMLEKQFRTDARHVICSIRPINYDLESLINLLNSIKDRAERGNFLESIWKFLLITEVARTMHTEILLRPEGAATREEADFLKLAEAQPDLFSEDFSGRLKYLITLASQGSADSPLRMSETVHTGPLKSLKVQLCALLERKYHIYFLIDNLDKAWAPQNNLNLMAEFIFALLGSASRLSKDFSFKQRTADLNVHAIIFLRSDIYSYILDSAREPDKMPLRDIDWHDEHLLLSVIQERLRVAAQFQTDEQVWQDLLTESVDGIPVRRWLIKNIIPRPRDLIHIVAAALKKAVARKHTKIDASDLKNALPAYSEFAVASLLVEARSLGEWMESVIYEFIGAPTIMRYTEIERLIDKVPAKNIPTDEIIALLVQLSFLGYDSGSPDEFRFEYGVLDRKKLSVILRKSRESGSDPKFIINQPFRNYLDIRAQ